MRKLIACSLALAAVAGISVLATAGSAQADEKASAGFIREFKAAKNALERKEKVETIDADPGLLGAYEVVLSDPYWSIRWPVVVKIAQFSSAESRADVAKYMRTIKDANARHQMVWAYAHSSMQTPEEWKALHDILKDPKENDDIKATVLRSMWRWMGSPLPKDTTGDSEEVKAKKDEERKKIMDYVQPMLKANFKAYLDFLKHLQADKDYKKKLAGKRGSNTQARLLQWLAVEGLEKLTSEERGDNTNSWDIFWTEVESKNLNLNYRFDDAREEMKIGDTNVKARTAVRQKAKKLTGVHMLFMPDDDSDLYFQPFDREFTQYFKLSSFIKPDGAKWGRKNDAQSYFYPDKEVAEQFQAYRKGQGGMIGMLTIGSAGYLAMEYAKADPDGCAFIICIGAWSGNDVMKQGRVQGENSKRDDIQNFYRSLYYPRPEAIWNDPLKNFHRETGQFSHRFSDQYDPDIYYLRQKLYEGAQAREKERSGLQSLIEPQYEVKGKGFQVPALFIFGKDDQASNQKKAQSDLSKMFPNADFVVMENVSLSPWLEDPIAFYDVFETFMEKRKVWERIEKYREAEEKEKKKGK